MTKSAATATRTADLIAAAERYAARAATPEYAAWLESHIEITAAYAKTAVKVRI